MQAKLGSATVVGVLFASAVNVAAGCEGVIANRTGGENPALFVPDNYSVSFNDPSIGVERVVLPPDPALRGKVPFPEASNGQTREQIAQVLQLHGRVVRILDTINAIALETDAAEARALSCDPRVKRVDQSQYLVVDTVVSGQTTATAPALHVEKYDGTADGTRPLYEQSTQTLQVPFVDTSAQAGLYQEARFQYEQDGRWRLLKGTQGTTALHIGAVEVVQTDSAPTQVLLRISGTFPRYCNFQPQPQPIIRQQANHMTVLLYDSQSVSPGLSCWEGAEPFQYTLALPVYGLDAGVYHYKVNGGFAGSFTVAKPNRL